MGIENLRAHISVLSVTNREYGTGAGFPNLAAAFGLLADMTAATIFLPRATSRLATSSRFSAKNKS
jgi:hypothetical protein